jgi:signal transduction histidine kinase
LRRIRSGAAVHAAFSPFKLFVLILVVALPVLAGVMTILPALASQYDDPWIETLVQTGLLTLVLAALLWSLVISPLRGLAESRSELLQRVITAQEDERRRIARDLHDGIGQGLTSLLIGLRTLEESSTFEEGKERARELRVVGGQLHDEVRRMAMGLRPSMLDDLGLAEALTRFARDFEQTYGISVSMVLPDRAVGRFPEALETALYRIAQEAMTNVAKHSGASRVEVVVSREPGRVALTVADNGRGFDHDKVFREAHRIGNLGLSSISERAALLNGTLDVDTAIGNGTTVRVQIPLVESWPDCVI